MVKFTRMAIVLVALAAGALYARAQSRSVTVLKVVDGDTFKSTDDETIRIIGIDAPEEDAASTAHLASLIDQKTVSLAFEGDQRDKYGRTLAYVELADGTDVGEVLIRNGMALVYVKYPCSRTDRYLGLEVEARKAGRGVWKGHMKSTLPPPDPSGGVSVAPSTQQASSQTVYVTRTGSKYHRAGCTYLKKSSIPISLEEAVASYGPCSRCQPPTLKAAIPSGTPGGSTLSPPSSGGGRCAAITKKGTRCKRAARAGSNYCWQHGG